MADTTKLSNAAVDVTSDALTNEFDNGYLRIYDGTQAADADTAVGAQVLLAELRFPTPAEASSTNGVTTFGTMVADAAANATGTASWFRALKADGTTALWDGSVGTSGATLNLNSIAISSGAEVDVTSLTLTLNKG